MFKHNVRCLIREGSCSDGGQRGCYVVCDMLLPNIRLQSKCFTCLALPVGIVYFTVVQDVQSVNKIVNI